MNLVTLLFFNLLIAVLIYIDANRLKQQGLKIAPIIWAFFVLAFSFIALLFYLIMRYVVWKVQLKAAEDTNLQKRSGIIKIKRGLIFVCVAGFLIGLAGKNDPYGNGAEIGWWVLIGGAAGYVVLRIRSWVINEEARIKTWSVISLMGGITRFRSEMQAGGLF